MDNEEFLKRIELMEERLLLRIEKTESKIDSVEERLLLRIEKTESKIDLIEERLLHRIEKSETGLEERLNARIEECLFRTEKAETALLNEFRKWAIPASGRMKTYEATLDEYRVRLGFIEDRLDALEHPPEAN